MSNIKIIAWHLPQYHAIPENDKWWGEGFTEWTNVKKAKPLYKNHYQPRVPLHQNYYDLSSPRALEEQCELAKKYGIYGFCFYHYWFNGKLLLEKPIEQMLDNNKIDFPYCFSWANEPWTKAWDGAEREVIMPQYYGGEQEWKEHYEYLRPFFQDERYIKVQGKPMFLIYRTENIPNCEEMIAYWNELAQKDGFAGIHLVETLTYFQEEPFCENSQAVAYMEPTYKSRNPRLVLYLKLIKSILFKNVKMQIESYDTAWKKIVRRPYRVFGNRETYLGAFVGWDNTARKGTRGKVIEGGSPEKFEKYARMQVEKSQSEFLFINAWNEWAEGTYLEPDERDKYGYLESIKNILR